MCKEGVVVICRGLLGLLERGLACVCEVGRELFGRIKEVVVGVYIGSRVEFFFISYIGKYFNSWGSGKSV